MLKNTFVLQSRILKSLGKPMDPEEHFHYLHRKGDAKSLQLQQKPTTGNLNF